MKKAIVALLILALLLLPMYAGIARLKRLPRRKKDD
jgi:fumarate reductase subunit D